jgi:hypothetical protein
MACLGPQGSAVEERALAILTRPLTMELTPPDRLRLVNEAGSLDLLRQGSE